jgi:hypothetical protein
MVQFNLCYAFNLSRKYKVKKLVNINTNVAKGIVMADILWVQAKGAHVHGYHNAKPQ